MTEPRRLTAPWTIEEGGESFGIFTSDGIIIAYVYFEDEPIRRGLMHRLTRDEARRVAANIAKLPDLLRKGPG